jgi:hypothetical protein
MLVDRNKSRLLRTRKIMKKITIHVLNHKKVVIPTLIAGGSAY